MTTKVAHLTYPNIQNTRSKKRVPFVVPLLIAMMAGAVFSLALAPYYLWTIAILSPMVLYATLVGQTSAWRAFWLGESYGFGVWVVGAFWLYTSIHEYGAVPSYLAVLMIVVMAMIMGVFHAVMAWVFVKWLGRQPLAFAGIWVLQEWAKTWVFTGFPWLFVGYAFTEVSWISSLAPVFGVFGISFVAVLFAASVVEIFRQKLGFLLLSFLPIAGGVVLYFVAPNWTVKQPDTLSVSLVQGNIPQDIKWLTEYRFETLKIYQQLSKSEWGRDVVIWPEASIPMTQDEAWPIMDEVYQTARQAGSTWVTGIPYKDLENFDPMVHPYPQLYNAVLTLGQNDIGLYKKQQLVPFGEYIPFEGMLNILPDLAGMQEAVSFSRGDDNQPPLLVKNKAMGSAICYEVAYPDTTRNNAKDTKFLLTVSNDAWFGTSAGPWQHLQMVQMRSLETGRWFVRATNTGVTAVIDEKGKIVKKAPQFVPTVLQATIPMFEGQTPFMRVGSYPVLGVSALLLLLSFIAKRTDGYDGNRPIRRQRRI